MLYTYNGAAGAVYTMGYYASYSTSELRDVLSAAIREADKADPRRRHVILRHEVDPICKEMEVRGLIG